MPRYRYTGKEEQIVAQIGLVRPNDVKRVTTEIGLALEKHDGDNWEQVGNDVPVTGEPEEVAAKANAQAALTKAGAKPAASKVVADPKSAEGQGQAAAE